jgi:eukaryotic-like serine/threonine-protein kinase
MTGPASVAPADWAGTMRYEARSRLGHGGMGVVYEAFDRERRQPVAIKRLLRYDPAGLYLFKQEFRTLADVRHTNLVHLYELVVDGENDVFFSMELVRGVDFLRHVRTGAGPRPAKAREANTTRPPPPRERSTDRPGASRDLTPPTLKRTLVDVDRLRPSLRQLVEGVHALHSAGKLHRDVKPSNVMVTSEGRVVLLDFGVATELRGRPSAGPGGSGELVGTAIYMAPEQADDTPPTPASDWYSVGIMLYEALVGQPPFGGSLIDVLTMKSAMDVRPPSDYVQGVPPDLDALCIALLNRAPGARPDGAEILRRLGATRSSLPAGPVVASDPGAFIGRKGQMQALREAYDASRAGGPVTLRVGGASGMGKSTLVHHFLDDLAENERAVILRGRAYEREAVPYKAIDAVIDSLSRHLLAPMEDGDAVPLPGDVRLLARLFPVLQGVPAIAELGPTEVVDPQAVRRRAFAALRDLLASLAARQPVILFVDDAQWGDVDSAALLLQVLRPPDAPSVLLLMTYRDDQEQTSPFLTEMRERWPQGAETRDVNVAPLDPEDALRLATTLLDATDDVGMRTARAVARESRGSPFLIEELVRSNRGAPSAPGATLGVLSLDQMIAERLDRLPEPARRFVELLAVGGRPLPVSALAAAAQVEESVDEVVTCLSTRRLLRTGYRDAREVVEPKHDRIRETIVAQLGASKLREHHERLARTLQDAPGADAEAVALHWLGAGDRERAARFAEGAAELAASKLAFDQAARLYRLTLEHSPAGSPDEWRLRARFGEVLRLAGRSEESARAFLAASPGAPEARRLELHRAASEQLLFSGRIDEGKEILRTVLAAVGMKAPQSPIAAVFWLVVYRVWLGLIGLRFKERTATEVPDRDRLRVDALATVALGFSLVDVVLGACMQARHLIEALRAGDRFQVARAMSIEAGHLAAAGGRESARERALAETAASLAEKDGSAEAAAFFAGSRGVGLFNRGRWREAGPLLEQSVRHAAAGIAGFEMARLFHVYNHQSTGELHEAFRLMNRLCAVAEERGDRYTLVNMRTSTTIAFHLAAGEPERAQHDLADALAQWTQKGFHVQHWQALVYGSDIELYLGRPERAYERFMAGMPALKKSLLLHAGFIRTLTCLVWGRVAIASLDGRRDKRRERLAEARRMVRKLDREHDAFAGGFARLIEASVESAEGRRDRAIAALRQAIERLETTGAFYYCPPARFRLGQLLGGDDGRALMKAATDELEGQGVRDPVRWSEALVPGTWSGPG